MILKSYKFILLLVILDLFASSCFATDVEDLFASVVYLKQEKVKTIKHDGKDCELWLKQPGTDRFEPLTETYYGSGVFFTLNNHPYLVTASHIAKQMTPTASAVVKGRNDEPIIIFFSDFALGKDGLNWINHEHADVSVLPINIANKGVLEKLQKHFLSADILVRDQNAPNRDTSLTTLGFPLQLGTKGKFSPISKTSKPASGCFTYPRFNTHYPTTFFILEDPSIGGFSGAAVFELPGIKLKGNTMTTQPNIRCYGIMHGTLSDNTGGKLAAVTPSIYILETLQKAEEVWKTPAL